ncbi:MAG: AMIN domain-containing protein, partial [Thermoanaerobaculia bacterium]|nr:AMIN domain-containing protein [Thermoanaerobaculia bacterium]
MLEKIEADSNTLILQTNVSPAFSSYSPQPGVYVVDLPQAGKRTDVSVPSQLPDAVLSVSADEAMELGATLTRVTIRLRPDVRPETVSFDKGIAIRFGDGGAEAGIPAPIIEEPLQIAEVPVKAAVAETAPAAGPAVTTQPSVAPRSSGKPATELDHVSSEPLDGGLGVRLAANGRVEYSAFKLENPSRLVIDLSGVRNAVDVPQQDLAHPAVRRVRVAQFQTSPRPITRVVFDLASPIDYQVALDGDSVFVAFGGFAPAPVAAAPPTESSRTSVFEAPPSVPVVAEAQLRQTIQQPAERHVVRAAADPAEPEMTGGQLSRDADSRTLSAGERIYTGEPIDLSLKDADVKDVLRTFAQLTGLNIAVDPGVSGTVTV